MTQIHIPDQLALFTGDTRTVEVPGKVIGEALQILFQQYPLLKPNIIDNKGHMHDFVRIAVDEKFLNPKTRVTDSQEVGTQIHLIVIASGG